MNTITAKTTGGYTATLEKVRNTEPLEIGTYLFKLEPEPLSPEYVEKAKNDLLETEENVIKSLAELRELLKGN